VIRFPHTACLSHHADLVGKAKPSFPESYLFGGEGVAERPEKA